MMLHQLPTHPVEPRPVSFAEWRTNAIARNELPVMLVSGSRGKSSVVRMLDQMLKAAGLRTATRTNLGVEIAGERQHGELAPWAHALERLALGSVDVAVEELDWSSIHALGRDIQRLPLAVVTNVCGNRGACLITDEARRAASALSVVIGATEGSRLLVLNGDDYAVTPEDGVSPSAIVFSQSLDSPALRTHHARGGAGVWTERGAIVAGTSADVSEICSVEAIPFSLHGNASFQVQNAMAAIAAGLSVGLDLSAITAGLQEVAPGHAALKDTFQTTTLEGVNIVVDRPNPSWFLRQVLRAVRDTESARVIAVAGAMPEVPLGDLPECARLIGRVASIIVFHAEAGDESRIEAFRRGVALNRVPPPIAHTRTERRAVERALAQAMPGDTVLILTEQSLAVLRALSSEPFDIGTSIEDLTPLAL